MSNKAHDLTFKQLISNVRFLKGFCQTYLPKELLLKLDVPTMQVFRANSEMVHQSIVPGVTAKTEIADVLCEIKFKGQKAKSALLLMHIEHFTNPPKHTILRMQNYALNAFAVRHGRPKAEADSPR